MYLKSLTLRGFKSFASTTTLVFEPGITCVVGPNGSGKSNVVDALAWVMGEQGAKSLRGGKMEDVIFAGTTGRAPLGRAEVVLTIDNSDGALPIDYTEVTISRTMFRSGGSEYAINGSSARLLDVQDLRGLGALHLAAMHGLLSVVQRLLREGANRALRDSLGRTPYDLALLRGYVDIATEFEPARPPPSLARFRPRSASMRTTVDACFTVRTKGTMISTLVRPMSVRTRLSASHSIANASLKSPLM